MSLQFIFGHSGAGKSYYLYETVIQESMKHPDKNYIVLVPEQFTMQTQRDFVMKHPRRGIMNIDVLSFGRLAFRVLEEVGGFDRVILDDEGKNLILRKIAGKYEDSLTVLKGSLKKPGYLSEVKSVISEFTQYDIGLTELERMIEAEKDHSYLGYKLRDIKTLYQGFYEYLEGKYITKEEILDVLSDVASRSRMLKDSVVVLDGFTGFTPVQNKLLKELMRLCEKIMVTVTIDEREDPFVMTDKFQLFALSKQMVSGLVRIAGEQHTLIDQPVCFHERPVRRFYENEAMAFMEAEIFRNSRRQYQKEQSAISLHCAGNPREEVSFVAQQIRSLVRREGYRYNEVAVITNDMSVYVSPIREIFSSYEIPVFMDQKRSVLLNSFVEYIRSLLAMVENQFTKDSVFRFLRTGLAGFEQEELDILENYVLALGIKGYKKWQEAWVRRPAGVEEEQLAVLNHMRVRLVAQLDELVFVLRQRRKSVQDITVALHTFLVQEEIQQKLKKQELLFEESGQAALAKEYAQIYRIVIELFEKFVELLGDEPVSLKEYCELLDAGLMEAKVGVIPPGVDEVLVGDMERTRLNDIKALFLIGVNDTLIPGGLGTGGLLSERDREIFADADLTLSPGSKEKIYIQKFYLYMNLTKPTKKLYLSYSKVSAAGDSLRPAYLVSEICRLYPKLTVITEDQTKFVQRELTPRVGAAYLAAGFKASKETLSAEWGELYSWYLRQQEWRPAIRRLLDASFYHQAAEGLGAEVAGLLYGAGFTGSITRLERFSSCAFAHFLTYGLRLRERQEYTFEALDMGNVFHSAIERYARKLEQGRYVWTDVPEAVKTRFIEESVGESIVDYGNTVLHSSARNEYMITRIKRMMHRTVWALTRQLAQGDFVPTGYEMKFAAGKIDRVDTYRENGKIYVKIIDYKTGTKSFEPEELYYGLQLQLPVYLNAAMEIEQRRNPDAEVIPAGIFYYQMMDPLVKRETDEEKLQNAILKELRPGGLVNADPDVIAHMDKGLSGNSLVIPVQLTKDGSQGAYSKTVTPQEFAALRDYARRKTQSLKSQILSGETGALPYLLGKKSGCDYCSYRSVCGFDLRIDGYEYRRLAKLSRQEAFDKMGEEV